MRKESTTLDELMKEYEATKAQIQKDREDINARRRNLAEKSSYLKDLENKINAKKYEQLTEAISQKTGLSLDSFTKALEKGNVLVDHDNNSVSEGHTEDTNEIQTEL